MKRKLWMIILALALLLTALCAGTALADEGLTFTQQPAVGQLDTETLKYPVTWETSFMPVRVEICDASDTEPGNYEMYYTGSEIRQSMSREYGTAWWGTSYIVRAYYRYDSYDPEYCRYVDSAPFILSEADPALSFTTQPAVGALDAERLKYPVSWATGFMPVRVEICDADDTEPGNHETFYTGSEIRQSMSREYGTLWWGKSYIVRAYYRYDSYDPEYCRYVDSAPFTLSEADPALSFTTQPAVGALDAERLKYPVSWATGFMPVRVEICDASDTEPGNHETFYTGSEIRQSMSREYGAIWWGKSYIVRAYYRYDSYDPEYCRYVDSAPFTLSEADPALSFTVQPAVGALDTERLKYPVSWVTGFLPVRVEICDASDTKPGNYETFYTGSEIRQSMSREYGTAWWGKSYIVRAYYRYDAYSPNECGYVDSAPFGLRVNTVTFDAGGGSGSMSSVDVEEGRPYTLPECGFTRAHHIFYKWQIGTQYYDPGDEVTITESITVRAVWKKTYTIIFSAGSGSGAGGSMDPLEVPANEEFILPACTFTPPEGKIFSRWGASGGLYYAPGDTVTATASLLFVAQWRSDRTVVGFDSNGGRGSMNPVSLTPVQASEYELPECTYAPPADSVFEKWQIIKHESGDTFYGLPGDLAYLSGCFNVTLKAIWVPKPSYEVSFNANGHGTAPQSQSVMQDKYAADPGALSAEGWTFLGWYTEAAGTNRFNFAETKITAPITLYAKWIDSITSIGIDGYVTPAAGMKSVTAPQITTGNTGYVCTRIEWRWPAANAGSGYGSSYTPITFEPSTEYTAVITLETVRDVLFDANEVPQSVTINGETAGVDLTRSGYVSETKYQLFTVPVTTENVVPIDEAHFPDAAFRALLQGRNYDLNGDGSFSQAEIGAITSLSAGNKGIASLEGVGILSSLKFINVTGNALTTLELDNCWALEEVYCSGNPNLAELSLPKSSWLKKLQCYGCALTWLDVRGITYLALAAGQTPNVSANGQTKTYTYKQSGVTVAEMIVDAGVTLYNDYSYYARVHFDPGVGTGSMPSVMVSKAPGANYTLPENGFTAPEDMYFNGWMLSGTGETFSAGETMDRLFTIEEHEVTFVAQWKSKTIISVTVPDAANSVPLGGAPVILSYNGTGSLSGGYWLSSYSTTDINGNVKASRLRPGTTYYGAILLPTTSLVNQIARGTLVVKNAEVVNIAQYTEGSSTRTFLIVSIQPRTVSVLFGKGGGSGTMRPVTGIIPGTAYTLPSCAFTAPADMVFDQWNLGMPGTTITLDEDVMLIARWKLEEGAIPVTADYFPDDAFRAIVSGNFDLNGGGYLTPSEIAAVEGFSSEEVDYTSVQGMEYFTELTSILLDGAPSLTHIDLTANTKLEYADVSYNGLTGINIEGLQDLTDLDVSQNSLPALDVSGVSLERLNCHTNPMTSLTLGVQSGLRYLACFGTDLATLDLRGCPLLLDCVNNGTKRVTAGYVEYKVDDTHVLRVDADTELIVPGMIAVDEANFPDETFRLWVSDNADRNGSGWLTVEEMDAVDAIYLNVPAYTGLESVQGIGYFTGVTELIIEDAPGLTSIDLSENTKIESLEIRQTGLTTLYVDGLPLEYLDCRNNALGSLTLGSQPDLTELHCCGNPGLVTLDLRSAPYLQDAALNGTRSAEGSGDLYEGPLGGKLHVDTNTELIVPGMICVDTAHFPDPVFRSYVAAYIDTNGSGWLTRAETTAVTSICIDSDDDLEAVEGIQYFTELNELILTNNPGLYGIDLSDNTKLTIVNLEYNGLTQIRLDGLASLRELHIRSNRLDTLDVSGLPALEYLDCEDNPLSSLILGGASHLGVLRCFGADLTSLDISGAPHLITAWLGTKDSSQPQYDRYTADGYILDVDKGLEIITGIPAPTFTLPAALITIEDEAFSGIAAAAVDIPASVTAIEGNPFSGSQVQYIYGTTELVRNFAEANGYIFVPVRE